jgi:hypothetical protein
MTVITGASVSTVKFHSAVAVLPTASGTRQLRVHPLGEGGSLDLHE